MDTITVNRGITAKIKAAELRDEAICEFSDSPFEFEATAFDLWNDTQKIYYHSRTANRFSEKYLTYCGQLEKNIRQLGSFCLTKAILKQKGVPLPKLSGMTIHELVCMVSFHYRKAHAALDGIYRDNNILGLTYLNWEFRWVGLGNRLKATQVKIQKIQDGRLNADHLLEQTETFRDDPRGKDKDNANITTPKSLRINPNALPVKGSMAREMLAAEKIEEKNAEAIRKEKERLIKEAERFDRKADRMPGIFHSAKPYEPDPEIMSILNRANARYLREKAEKLSTLTTESTPEPVQTPAPEKESLPPGHLGEEEARTRLLEDAMKRGDQEAIRAIPTEDTKALHARWLKYTARVEREEMASRYGPSAATRKALREKRKKKRKT